MKKLPKDNMTEDVVDAIMDHIDRWLTDYTWQEDVDEKCNFQSRMKQVVQDVIDRHV